MFDFHSLCVCGSVVLLGCWPPFTLTSLAISLDALAAWIGIASVLRS